MQTQTMFYTALQYELDIARAPDLLRTNATLRLQYMLYWCTEIKLDIPRKMNT